MAKKAVEETAGLTKRSVNTALAVADGSEQGDRRGKELIEQDDITLPRIAIAQALSRVLDKDKAEYSESVQKYDLYNTTTGVSYGRGPIKFVVVMQLPKRAMQTDKDGNIVEFDVPWDDPRCEFTAGPNGERVKPVAARLYDYLVVLPDAMEIAILSMSKMGTKAAKKLNAFQQIRPGAAWQGVYTVETVIEHKAAFTFGNFVVKPAGATPRDVAEFAAGVYESMKGRNITTDRSDLSEADQSSDTGDM